MRLLLVSSNRSRDAQARPLPLAKQPLRPTPSLHHMPLTRSRTCVWVQKCMYPGVPIPTAHAAHTYFTSAPCPPAPPACSRPAPCPTGPEAPARQGRRGRAAWPAAIRSLLPNADCGPLSAMSQAAIGRHDMGPGSPAANLAPVSRQHCRAMTFVRQSAALSPPRHSSPQDLASSQPSLPRSLAPTHHSAAEAASAPAARPHAACPRRPAMSQKNGSALCEQKTQQRSVSALCPCQTRPQVWLAPPRPFAAAAACVTALPSASTAQSAPSQVWSQRAQGIPATRHTPQTPTSSTA